MLALATKYFGTLSCQESSLFEFPKGIPAFEFERHFAPVELPDYAPLVFLQSTTSSELCFLALPIQVLDKDYSLSIGQEELELVGLDPGRPPRAGSEILILALISFLPNGPVTANLMAPVVVNLKTLKAVQSIRHDQRYSAQHPLAASFGARLGQEKPC